MFLRKQLVFFCFQVEITGGEKFRFQSLFTAASSSCVCISVNLVARAVELLAHSDERSGVLPCCISHLFTHSVSDVFYSQEHLAFIYQREEKYPNADIRSSVSQYKLLYRKTFFY